MQRRKRHDKVSSRSAERPPAAKGPGALAPERRAQGLWPAALLIGLALPLLAGCPRPNVQGPSQASQVAAVERPLAAAHQPPAVSRPKRGRSGPPPLGLIERPAGPKTAPALAARPAPEVPPRKPVRPLPSRARVGEDPTRDDTIEPVRPKQGRPKQELGQDPTAAALPEDPKGLMGLTPRALTELLGQPALVRHEAMAQIWQYRQPACVFDIFFYEEADALKVSYYEARDHQARKLLPEACYAALLGQAGSG